MVVAAVVPKEGLFWGWGGGGGGYRHFILVCLSICAVLLVQSIMKPIAF